MHEEMVHNKDGDANHQPIVLELQNNCILGPFDTDSTGAIAKTTYVRAWCQHKSYFSFTFLCLL